MTVNKIKINVLISFFIVVNLLGQTSRKDLEKQRKKTEEQIALTKKILKETTSKKAKNQNELKSIARLIETREELIGTINQELEFVNQEVDGKKDEVDSVNSQLAIEKQNYAKAIVLAYKNKRVYNNTLYLFAAKSFNQLFQRIRFIQYLSAAQTKFLAKINEKKIELETKLKELFGLKESKIVLAKDKESEVKELESDKVQKSKTIASLQGKETELQAELTKQKKAKENLNAQINGIIAKEIAEAKRKAKEQAAKTAKINTTKPNEKKPDKPTVVSKEPTLTPEAKLVSDNFAASKGKLPWPVEKGFISEHFGTHAHAQLEQVMIQNNGVDIQTNAGSVARCVQKGTVAAIISIPGMGKIILVNHGEYFTVYSKLQSVTVSQGETLSIKQTIGTISQDEDGATEIHFEIWLNQDKQNPEAWLSKH